VVFAGCERLGFAACVADSTKVVLVFTQIESNGHAWPETECVDGGRLVSGEMGTVTQIRIIIR